MFLKVTSFLAVIMQILPGVSNELIGVRTTRRWSRVPEDLRIQLFSPLHLQVSTRFVHLFFSSLLQNLTRTHVCLTLSASVLVMDRFHFSFFPSVSFKLLLFPVAFLRLAAPLCCDLDDVDSFVFLFVWLCFFFFFFFKGKIKDTKEIKCKMKVLILHVFTNLDISKLLLLFCSCFWGFVLLIAEKTNWVKWQVQGHRTPVSSQTETVAQRLSQSLNFPRQKGRQICKSLKDLSHRPYVKHVPEF